MLSHVAVCLSDCVPAPQQVLITKLQKGTAGAAPAVTPQPSPSFHHHPHAHAMPCHNPQCLQLTQLVVDTKLQNAHFKHVIPFSEAREARDIVLIEKTRPTQC